MANPTAFTAPHQIMEMSGLALRVSQLQNEAGEVIVDGESAQQANEADLAVTDVATTYGAVKVASVAVDASGGGTGQTTAIVTVPANSVVLSVLANVTTVFDGNATTTLEVGISGNADKYIDTMDFDVTSATAATTNGQSTNADNNVPTAIADSSEAIIATWTNDAAASTGEVQVTVIYLDPAEYDLAGELAAAFAEVETTVNSLITKLEDAGILADS